MPPDDRTIVEGSSPDGSPSGGTPGDSATIIEGVSSDSSTIIEGAQARAEAGFNLVPGGQFQGHTLLKPLQVASGEADLWFIADAQGKEYVLKLYRYGIKPKEEITEKIRSLGYEHVVTIEESGEVSGRHFEILEKIEHGDLDEFAGDKPLEEEQLKVVVEKLGSAVAHLHEAGIIHRDIKPANILVRTLEPLDLVMTDFGISSVSDVSLHMTSVNRTALYSAPEAINGVVARGSDWWCVGIIFLKLLLGKHPLEGMTEQAITFQLVTKGVKVPEEIGQDWQLLLKGLLTRDPENRWAWSEVEQWLGGKRDIATQYEGDQKEEKRYDYKPYKLRGKEIYEPKDLAVYLGENWPEGVKQFGRGYITKWVENDFSDQGLASDLTDITEDEELDGDGKLSGALMVMAPDLPMFWKGEVVSRDWLGGNPEVTAEISQSRLLYYYEQHHPEDELKLGEIAERVKEVAGDARLQGEERDLVIALAVNPEHPLKLGEGVINPEWLAANPKKAVELCQSTLPEWHKHLCKEDWLEAIAERVKEVLADKELKGEIRDAVISLAMNPEHPLKLGEDVINPEWLAAHPGKAMEICQSSLPEWHKRLCKEDWLEKKAKLVLKANKESLTKELRPGSLRWKFETGGNVYSSPAIGSDGTVYVGSADFKLYAINGKSGVKLWEFQTGGEVRSSPAIGSDGTVYVGSNDKKLYAINGKSEVKLWEFETGSAIGYSSPAIGSDGTVYVGSFDKKLYAINGKSGVKLWEFETGHQVYSSPAIGSDGTVYVGSLDKNLYAIKTDSKGPAKSPWPMRGQNAQHTGRISK